MTGNGGLLLPPAARLLRGRVGSDLLQRGADLRAAADGGI